MLIRKNRRVLLDTVLYYYHDIILGTLPIQAQPNWKLGDIHEIPLMEGAEPVKKSIYSHSP